MLQTLPAYALQTMARLHFFIVENRKTALRHCIYACKQLGLSKTPIEQATFYELSEKGLSEDDTNSFLQALFEGMDVGLLSEAGCPAVADPGSEVVRLAHENGIIVRPVVGPSSIMLALMSSGLNGQNFAFNGYLPVEKPARKSALLKFEKKIYLESQTQLFIETPYRNMALLEEMLSSLQTHTWLCTATDLTLASEEIYSRSVGDWRNETLPALNKRPTIFCMGVGISNGKK